MTKIFYPTPEDYEELEDTIIPIEPISEEELPQEWLDLLKQVQQEPEHKITWKTSNTIDINQNVPNCCRFCPVHPSNGGSGICFCTAPYNDDRVTSTPTWIYHYDYTC